MYTCHVVFVDYVEASGDRIQSNYAFMTRCMKRKLYFLVLNGFTRSRKRRRSHSNESGLLLRKLKLHLYLRLTLTIKNLKGKLISPLSGDRFIYQSEALTATAHGI